ncbi:uncharacterized protein LOC129003489 [Macrosteles quadrilineatus]|uniref:uncharacterized protein LOC129003489 n=1 Tax=Macrosteles quadrilineatus TaxID=74068 RepID=UPI0023E26843|nr:uncharacterized protein LOC129003489 [Macrosteles quadrilineatus]
MILRDHRDQEDPHCTHHIHKLYRHMKCEPEISAGAKCPTNYKCATLGDRSADRCYYGGKSYNVGFNLTNAMVEFHSPCIQSCQCVRMYEGHTRRQKRRPLLLRWEILQPTLGDRSADRCYYGGKSYNVGFNLTSAMVEFHSPCIQSCQCVRMYEGARFYCSHDVRRPKVCPAPSGCRHYSFLEDFTCCQRGVVSCNKGKPDSVKCVHGGLSYSEGEKFFPHDDITCTQCICASGFNGTIAPPYCQQFACDLELWGDTPIMLTRGCIPVYLSDHGCCPISFRCPKPSDRIVKAKDVSVIKSGKHCRFGNLTMDVGDKLSPWLERNTKEVECSCRVPPMASCVRRNFTMTPELRREFAREGLDNKS